MAHPERIRPEYLDLVQAHTALLAARVVNLADAGHLPWLDEPSLSAELIAGFLAEDAIAM